MPTYTFTNTKTGKEFTEMMTIAEMENYLKKIRLMSMQEMARLNTLNFLIIE